MQRLAELESILAENTNQAVGAWDLGAPRGDVECWPWQGYVHLSGHGMFTHKRKTLRAHRVAYELTRGPIPKGMVVDHLCQNLLCLNPAHMNLLTPGERLSLAQSRNARAAGAKKIQR